MKHLEDYKIFEGKTPNKEEIDAICKKYHITDYTINNDGSIDVDGDVELCSKQLTKLPLKFNRVSGNFYCYQNNLTSLEGCPKYIGDNFSCAINKLTSLEGGPKYVVTHYSCACNRITSLEGGPEYVGFDFICNVNPIYSIIKHFIEREDKNNLVELFNYYDIVQDMSVIYDRLVYFYETIDIKLRKDILENIEMTGYKIIY